MELGAGGAAVFRRPDGRAIPEAPALPPVEEDPVTAFEGMLAEEGIALDPRASEPTWDGGRVEYWRVIEWLGSKHPVN